MSRHVNAISGRLSLRPPQRRSLEILDRVMKLVPPRKGIDPSAALDVIRAEFPSVTDFERDFPSVCFALATGVGKTRLMGAFITYLHQAHGIDNFFVLAPNLTIYDKLITDFSQRNHPKYVFKGIAEFATNPPEIITGETYEERAATLFDELVRCKINIFNISKINTEVRGGRAPRIKRLSEYIGESYFDYLANLPDLVLLMDESHRYRASAGVRAINELKPILGLELTATPFIESRRGAVPFKNVIYHYPLAKAMEDGFVKEPAVVTRKDFDPTGMAPPEIELIKLEDGIRLHESLKVELETYARQMGRPVVKPFLLVIARDTTHAGQLLSLIESDAFFEGRYREKVIQVDSSTKEDEVISRLLKVEHTEEPTEIVIHVNMLKEGWDVTNLYTIVPLRAASARVLIEQSIGRGLRLPYGYRTGITSVDRLNIVAHDRFQEIIEEARRPDSVIRLKAVELDPDSLKRKSATAVSQPRLAARLGIRPPAVSASSLVENAEETPAFSDPEDARLAQIAYEVIRSRENRPDQVPTIGHLHRPDVQAEIAREVEERRRPTQLEFDGLTPKPNVAEVVARTVDLVTRETIAIPRILVLPKGELRSGFRLFTLDLSSLNYPPVSDELWVQYLRTDGREMIDAGEGGVPEQNLEDYVVSGLVDFDDISYDDHADLLYDLAGQVVEHLQQYLTEDQVHKVLRCYQRPIAKLVHSQMQEHYWEEVSGHETTVSKGFTELKESAYSYTVGEPVVDYRVSPPDKQNISRYLFSGFQRCLYDIQKFDSDAERKLALILDRDAEKWFRPVRGQFHIYYRAGADPREYQPDFVAETQHMIYMLEPKRSDQLDDELVLKKRDAAIEWCRLTSEHAAKHDGKAWRYVTIPHGAISENVTLDGLVRQYGH